MPVRECQKATIEHRILFHVYLFFSTRPERNTPKGTPYCGRSRLRDGALFDDIVTGVVLHPGGEIHANVGPVTEQHVVMLALVIDDDCPRRNRNLPGHADVRGLAVSDHRIPRGVAVMIKDHMKFDGDLGLTELRPVKHGQAQVDGRGIRAHELLFEAEFVSSTEFAGNPRVQPLEHILVQFPGPMPLAYASEDRAGAWIPRCASFPSLLLRLPSIFRNERARPSWQNIIATNWLQLESPFAARSAPVSLTMLSNSILGTGLSTWLSMLQDACMLGLRRSWIKLLLAIQLYRTAADDPTPLIAST